MDEYEKLTMIARWKWEDDFFIWHEWFAWRPVKARNGAWLWLRSIEFRQLMLGYNWALNPEYRYRERKG